jgi:predicted ATPase/class 3 adenylate cyclase
MALSDEHGLPHGTVTLLFADLEGSTRLLHALGTEYAALLARQRTIIREIAARHNGREVDWAGDGAFLAFERATGAVAAAAELVTALEDEAWPSGARVRLRIGIHTGEPSLNNEGYVGIDVHRAARICGAAHGCQILLSRASRDLVGEEPFPGASLRPLGAFRLKDILDGEHLYQLVAPGLPDGFPPVRTLAGATLPALHYPLVGRREELAAVRELLARDDVRLVTVIGPGGAGKSRLALEVASRLAAERPVHLVGLASIADPALVPAAIARALGVRESRDGGALETVSEALLGSGALLVLDNLEHLAPAAPLLGALLESVPDLDALVTSRARLRLASERVVVLDPLPLADAEAFFGALADARGVRLAPGSEAAVREICERLDGLPLAIELVAARLGLFSPEDLLRALGEGLALETEGPVDLPARQRTLRAAIDWSYRLLSEGQRDLHSALTVFAGGFGLDAARTVTGAVGTRFLADVEALLAVSLLRADTVDGETRLSLLETVREYGLARLDEQGRLDAVRRRHAEYFFALADAAEAGLAGPEQAVWLERVEREHDNLRAALDWSLQSGRVEQALWALSTLGRFWRAHGHVTEARRLLQTGLESDADVPRDVRATALWTLARQAMAQRDHRAAMPALEEALSLFDELGDTRNAVFARCELSRVALADGDLERAEAVGDKALAVARASADTRALSAALNTLASVASDRGDVHRAMRLYDESLELRRSLDDPLLVANTANNLGLAAMLAGDLDAAAAALEESLTLARALGDAVHTAAALCGLGEVALARGDADRAASLLAESYALSGELADARTQAECLHALGGVAAALGQPEQAARLWGAAEAMRGRLGAALRPEERAAVDDRFGALVHDQLGDEEFTAKRHEGAGAEADALVASVDEWLGTAAVPE